MTETKVGFLYKLASSMPQSEKNDSLTLLRSYYTMRCKELTRGFGLPDKQFSNKARCPHCCLEWRRTTYCKITPVKLSKRQRKRIKSKKINKFNKYNVENRKKLLYSNEMEQICSFCKKTTVTPLLKPAKEKLVQNEFVSNDRKKSVDFVETDINYQDKLKETKKNLKKKSDIENKKIINVYSNAFDVFSMNNEKNTLQSIIKEKPKIIKNNKKKKDKFAGLCQKAVLASVKIKEERDGKNKLNLFLKPSS